MTSPDTTPSVGATAMPSTSPALAVVAVKLPAFWTMNPEAWFHHAEVQFAFRNISLEETHYFYVVSSLDAATSVRVAPFLLNLVPRYSYTELKKLLLDTYRLSDDERARLFLNMIKLGDRRPSEVMDQMLFLHGRESPNFVLRYTFKRILPPPVRHTLTAFADSDPRVWARQADKLMVDFEECAALTAAVWETFPTRSLPPPLVETSPILAVAAPANCLRRRFPPPPPHPPTRSDKF